MLPQTTVHTELKSLTLHVNIAMHNIYIINDLLNSVKWICYDIGSRNRGAMEMSPHYF